MTIKLLKFPFLIQIEILNQLDVSEKFVLSLCSLKTMNIIKMVGIKHIKTISYASSYHICRVKGTSENDRKRYEILNILPMYLVKHLKSSERKHVRISGTSAICGFPSKDDTPGPLCIYHTYPNDQIPEIIHNHISTLFGSHINFTFDSSGHRQKCIFLPMFSNLKSSWISCSYPIGTKKLNDFFETSPNQELVEIRLDSPLGPSSKLFTTQHLNILATDDRICDECLHYFQGRSVISNIFKLSDSSVIDFLEKWISGEKFQNLEFLKFESFRNLLVSPLKIMQKFLFKRFDPSKPFPVFQYIERRSFGSSPFQFYSPFYVVRDCDGTVASMDFSYNLFVFGVWNLNEKQMAEKFYT